MDIRHVLSADDRRFSEIVLGERPLGRIDPDNLRPTLLIGVGGTGHDIANSYKSMLIDMTGDDQPKHVRILVMDTADETPECGDVITGSEKVFLCPPSLDEYLEYKKSSVLTDLCDWVVENDETIVDFLVAGGEAKVEGASGSRQFGRICLYHCMRDIARRLETEIEHVLGESRAMGREANIVVVGSAGGGTGTGCIIDLMFLIRELIKLVKAQNAWDLKVYTRCGLVIGDALFARVGKATESGRRQFHANSYAFLKELDAFVSGYLPFSARYPGSLTITSNRREDPQDTILFNDLFLFDRYRDVDGWESPPMALVEQWRDFVSEVALGFLHLGYGPIHDEHNTTVLGNRPRVRGLWTYRKDNDPPRKQRRKYSSFGVVEVHLPAAEIMQAICELVAVRAARRMADGDEVSIDVAGSVLISSLESLGPGTNTIGRNLTPEEGDLPLNPKLVVVSRLLVSRIWKVLSSNYRTRAKGKTLDQLREMFQTKLDADYVDVLRKTARKENLISTVDDSGKLEEEGDLYSALNDLIGTHGAGHTAKIVDRLKTSIGSSIKALGETIDSGPDISRLREKEYGDKKLLKEPLEPSRGLLGRLFKLPSAEHSSWQDTHSSWEERVEKGQAAWIRYSEDYLSREFLKLLKAELELFERTELTGLRDLLEDVATRIENRCDERLIAGDQPYWHRRIRGLDADDLTRIRDALFDTTSVDNAIDAICRKIEQNCKFPFDDPQVDYEDLLQEVQSDRLSLDDLKDFVEAQIVASVESLMFGDGHDSEVKLLRHVAETLATRASRGLPRLGAEIDLGNPRFLENILSRSFANELYDRVADDLRYSVPALKLRTMTTADGGGGWDRKVWQLSRTSYDCGASDRDTHRHVSHLWRDGKGKFSLVGDMGDVPDKIWLSEMPGGILQFRQVHDFPLFMLGNLAEYEKTYRKLLEDHAALRHIRREYVDLPNLTMDDPQWRPEG